MGPVEGFGLCNTTWLKKNEEREEDDSYGSTRVIYFGEATGFGRLRE